MFRKIIRIAIIVLYGMATFLSLYDFSLHSDFVPWGDSHRDGLDMLIVIYFCFPVMVLLSFIKLFFWKENKFTRFSFLLYSFVFFLFAICLTLTGSAIGVLVAMITALVLMVCTLVESCLLMRSFKSSPV